ncbi:MAG: GNAT family N-acetyltransferase [Spirochaetia bacterium]|nr:GNAT family N-acetyltransferase [Spirochaetia bacterium]
MNIVDGKNYLTEVRDLIMEYSKWLGRDLSFQNIDSELKNPALKYSAPEGEILVAVDEGIVLGMVAYHRHTDTKCEMKRLYVKTEARGLHLGDLLVNAIIEHAKAAGFKEMVLDTIEPLKTAISLYKKYGFEECEAYYDNPMPDVIYMKKSF